MNEAHISPLQIGNAAAVDVSLLVLSTSSAVMAVWLRRLRWSSRLPIWRR